MVLSYMYNHLFFDLSMLVWVASLSQATTSAWHTYPEAKLKLRGTYLEVIAQLH